MTTKNRTEQSRIEQNSGCDRCGTNDRLPGNMKLCIGCEEQEKVDKVREYMAKTTGSQEIHKHWMGLLYTDGLHLVAEVCGAHWLLDIVASYQPKLRQEEFQVWRLSKPAADDKPWLIEAFHDVPGRLLIKQEFEYSDFPADLTPFEFWVENNTAMLKEER